MRSTILILLFAALLSPAARAEEKTPEAFARIETELKQERPDAWEIKDIIYHAPAFSADEKQKIAEQIELSALPYKQKIILRNYLGHPPPGKICNPRTKDAANRRNLPRFRRTGNQPASGAAAVFLSPESG